MSTANRYGYQYNDLGGPDLGQDLDQYLSNTINLHESAHRHFQLVRSDTNSTLAGLPAYTFVFTKTSDTNEDNVPFSLPLKIMQIGTIANGKVVYLHYYASTFADVDKFSLYLPIVQDMINSLKIDSLISSSTPDPDLPYLDNQQPPATVISIVQGASNPNNGIFYDPSNVEVSAGSTVRWTNHDNAPHTVTSGNSQMGPNDQFDSGTLQPNSVFDFQFEQAGMYEYYCTIHPFISGRIQVR